MAETFHAGALDLPDRLVGARVVLRPFDEAAVLAAGDAYEAATPWHAMHPPLDGG